MKSSIWRSGGAVRAGFAEKFIEGWALPEVFSRENLEVLANNYPKAIEAIVGAFYRELLGNREKN